MRSITAPDSWKSFQEALQYIQDILCYNEILKYEATLTKIEFNNPSKHTHRIISVGSDVSDEMEEDREDGEVPLSPIIEKPEMMMPLEGLCENANDKLDHTTFEPYFLPSQNSGGSTTPCLREIMLFIGKPKGRSMMISNQCPVPSLVVSHVLEKHGENS